MDKGVPGVWWLESKLFEGLKDFEDTTILFTN